MGFGVWGLGFGFRVWSLGFGVWGLGLGFRVWSLQTGVWGLGFGAWGLGFGVGAQEAQQKKVQNRVPRRSLATLAQVEIGTSIGIK